MNPTLRILAALVVWWLAFPTVSRIGETWQLQAYPLEGVTVTMPSGETFQGALSREWNGTWFVINGTGQATRFSMDEAIITRRKIVLGETSDVGMPVRPLLPVAALTFLAVAFVIWPSIAPRAAANLNRTTEGTNHA